LRGLDRADVRSALPARQHPWLNFGSFSTRKNSAPRYSSAKTLGISHGFDNEYLAAYKSAVISCGVEEE
jgi:hypothetical protein